MLSVRYGPFQPELERGFLEELAALKGQDPLGPVAVVAPSRRLAGRLQRLVSLEAGASYLGVRFHTFYSLAVEIAGEQGPTERQVNRDPVFFDRLLDSLLGAGWRPRGLAAATRASLRDLIDAGVEPRFAEMIKEGLLADKSSEDDLRRLLGLLGRYEARLEELGVMPVSGLVRRATELCGEGALSKYRALLYYGFYDLTGLQADFLHAVARERPVTAFYPFRKGHPAFEFAQKFFETKLHVGARPPRELVAGGRPRALAGVLDALFEPGRRGSVEPGRLRVFTASGARDEAWRAAKEILLLAEEEGMDYSDIGVVVRTLEPYRAALAEAFAESGVPYHTSASEPLLRRPAARACLTLLTLARRDFPALAVLDLVESPFFKGPSGPRWRRLVRRLGLHRGWLQWEGKLAPEPEAAPLWEILQSWRRALRVPGRRKWSEWAAYAAEFLGNSLAGEGEPSFERALEELSGLKSLDLLDEPVEWAQFLEGAEEALGRAVVPAAEPNGGVRVLDAMQARGESFRVLFILGLSEGIFPRAVREDPLLRDSARSALRETAGYWISTKQAGHEEERLLFYLAVSSAAERLYCSYPRSDEEGRARIPSVYLVELCRAAGLESSGLEAERVPRQPFERLASPRLALTLSPGEASVAAALAGAEDGSLGETYRELVRRVDGLNRPGAPGAWDGIIGPPRDYLRELRLRGLSPSSLESLARCPFQFYASRVLGLDEPEEPSPSGEVSAAIKGEMYHKALASFHGSLQSSGYWDKGGAFPEAAFKRATDEVFGAYGWRELGMYPLLWDILREGMLGHLRRFLEWDLGELRSSGMRPLLLEAPARATVGLRLPEGLEGMELQGRIDRVDAGGGGFRVVDYKTHVSDGSLERVVLSGKSFQPPVYLELAARHPALGGLKPRGAVFYSLEDSEEEEGRPSVREYPASSHERGREAFLENLARMVDSVSRGAFPIRPDEGERGYCGWCSFSGMCRKNHPMTLARAKGGA